MSGQAAPCLAASALGDTDETQSAGGATCPPERWHHGPIMVLVDRGWERSGKRVGEAWPSQAQPRCVCVPHGVVVPAKVKGNTGGTSSLDPALGVSCLLPAKAYLPPESIGALPSLGAMGPLPNHHPGTCWWQNHLHNMARCGDLREWVSKMLRLQSEWLDGYSCLFLPWHFIGTSKTRLDQNRPLQFDSMTLGFLPKEHMASYIVFSVSWTWVLWSLNNY